MSEDTRTVLQRWPDAGHLRGSETCEDDMVLQRVAEDIDTFLVLDDQGRPIGRIRASTLDLDGAPPSDTVYLTPSVTG
ncbi:MAG: hypothetical protein AB7V35_08540 [Gemmatimonadales bacterium]|nr:hypothetical protein [Gemmatimonadota bacterium]